MFLDDATFTRVLASTPLVSVDLIVQNQHGQFLVGKRTNKPAQGYWFVPGGRIQKNESIASAFQRLTLAELGEVYPLSCTTPLGTYEHFYDDSVFGDSISTHYIVIAYSIQVERLNHLPTEQHSLYRWMSIEELRADCGVHQHTKAYFLKDEI